MLKSEDIIWNTFLKLFGAEIKYVKVVDHDRIPVAGLMHGNHRNNHKKESGDCIKAFALICHTEKNVL